MKKVISLFTALLIANPAASQSIASYYAEIGIEDMHNSSGTRLTDIGAILQQDRANFHRFGIRHSGDDSDPVFDNRQMRAAIPQLYRNGPNDKLIADIIEGGNPLGILVSVCGTGGHPSYLVVDFADGDYYNGC